jgi:uncharacterized protein YbaP (TraB family)
MRRLLLLPFFLLFFTFSAVIAQKKTIAKKYPSLFWEITGNGLKKPSYLFGTMHVSSKMAFHLSDSFYHAMRNTDAVALELNPEIWQDEMFKLQKAQLSLARFSMGKMNDFLKESSFKLEKYETDIRKAITEEPTVVNNLLYRSYQSTADFEENTYLDLYIYQTGRKLGKRPAGVENYMESERLMLEAYQDMAKDKTKRRPDADPEAFYGIQQKIQQAYRNGDLDLMDSLQNLTSMSPAFSEKFLYVRNEIQAYSIDTIIKRYSLFVGVGAAHLPGPRGVIELLRKKGYRLRPIFMQDRDATQKEEIDKLKVPVVFHTVKTPDGLIQLQLPGKFYKREEAKGNESWQYADMNNGSYYMLTRVRTHAVMLGHNTKTILSKVDSMLYENIPGKILKKIAINKNGYPGFDITNRTRRGDLQRYQIVVTPYEVLVFKMSGNDGYVEGKEADTYFSSIKIKDETEDNWKEYEPKQGGFAVKMPGLVNEGFDKTTADGNARWEYEATDKNSGNAYMIWKKSLYNFNFIEEDTFDLSLIEESFKRSDLVDKQVSRRVGVENRVPFLEANYLLKDGAVVTSKAFIKGSHYYLLAIRSANKKADFNNTFFKSFRFTNYRYPKAERYIDSSLKLEVLTAVRPNVDTTIRSWMEKAGRDVMFMEPSYSAWPKTKTGIFASDSTGESILVNVQTFPKYYYSRDSARFWREKLEEQEIAKDMVFKKKEYFQINDSLSGYNVILADTNSSRCIKIAYYLKGNNLYKFSTVTDSSAIQSDFIKDFYATARPLNSGTNSSVFKNKLDVFFADYNSSDSVVTKQAGQAISSMYFGKEGLNRIVSTINKLKFGDKDYFEKKSKFIAELGYISDSASKETLVPILKDLYEKNADTGSFQNPVLVSLARLQTKKSFTLLKELLTQDPPIFDNSFEYERLFNQFTDTLPLAKNLFPEILQLASLEDYKPHINGLLKSMIDSGYATSKDYEMYFSKLYFDAKIELKKQQNKEEKRLGLASTYSDDNDDDNNVTYRRVYNNSASNSVGSNLADYAVLLFPFYDKNPAVKKFYERLLTSKDVNLQLAAIKVLAKNNKKIPDSLLLAIAAKDQYRAKLLAMLEKQKQKGLFPAKYNKQEFIAKSLLLNDKNYKEFADIQLVLKKLVQVKDKKGFVYLFRYKIKNDDDWKMGISGLQPLDSKDVSSNKDLVKLTEKKIKSNEAEANQFDEQLKQLLFAKHKSGRRFFDRSGGGWDFYEGEFQD